MSFSGPKPNFWDSTSTQSHVQFCDFVFWFWNCMFRMLKHLNVKGKKRPVKCRSRRKLVDNAPGEPKKWVRKWRSVSDERAPGHRVQRPKISLCHYCNRSKTEAIQKTKSSWLQRGSESCKIPDLNLLEYSV
jgi:hypothetical protein